jgi:hypothetical protein
MMINSPDVMPRRPQEPEMLSLLDRHKIQVLLEAGHTKADVAERTGASEKTLLASRPSQTTPIVDHVRVAHSGARGADAGAS